MTTLTTVEHELRIMGPTKGDTKLKWDESDADSLRLAKAAFAKAIGKGFKAFRVDRKGKREGEPITEFDPGAEQIILVPQIVGG